MVKRKSSRVFDMTPKDAYEKCRKKDKRILELEKIISTDSYYSYRYAYIIIGGPFEKCHSIIFNSDYKNDYIIFLKSINYDLNKISEWLI